MGKVLLWLSNLLLVALLTARVVMINNDKGIAVFIVAYGLIIAVNCFLWLLLVLLGKKVSALMIKTIPGLVLLMIPLVLIIGSLP